MDNMNIAQNTAITESPLEITDKTTLGELLITLGLEPGQKRKGKTPTRAKLIASAEPFVKKGDITLYVRENYRAFLRKLKELSAVNSMEKPIIVNELDCQGTLFVNPDRSLNEQRIVGVRRKTFRITPERVDAAPELLPFDKELYRTFIKSGIVHGDEIEYETTFGIKLKISGNTRTLKQFLGFKRVNSDKTVEYLTATYQVNGGPVCKKKQKNKSYKEKK